MFRIAGHLKIPVCEVRQRIPPCEELLWQAWYALHPFGEEVEYLAKLLATKFKLSDFFDDWKDFRPLESQMLDPKLSYDSLARKRKKVATAGRGLTRAFSAIADATKGRKDAAIKKNKNRNDLPVKTQRKILRAEAYMKALQKKYSR